MTYRNPLARAIRLAIGGAVGLSTVLAAPAAVAQESEDIVVIGSRIARSGDFEGPSPVLTVDREAIENSGFQNLQQLMETLPVNGNGAFSTRGNNQDSTANGAASISLRGLGADATLVLVNGRRVAISSFAESVTTNFVDINTIPVAAIERVEVLKDGASALYGTDAVAGVINIVLRQDFEGVEVAAGYGDVTSGSAAETYGIGPVGHGRRRLEHHDDLRLLQEPDARPTASAAASARPNNSAHGGADYRSSRGFPGRFFVGTARPSPWTRRCPPGSQADPTCLYDYGPWNLLVPESERTGLMLSGHQALGGGGIEVFTELAVQHNKSLAQGAPTPLDETAGMTLNNHPNDPFGGQAIGISRFRTVDAGPRRWHIETDNLRGVLGLRGEFNDWDWEVAVAARAQRVDPDRRPQRRLGAHRFPPAAAGSRRLQPVRRHHQRAGRDRRDHHQPGAPGRVEPDHGRRLGLGLAVRDGRGRRHDGGRRRIPRRGRLGHAGRPVRARPHLRHGIGLGGGRP